MNALERALREIETRTVQEVHRAHKRLARRHLRDEGTALSPRAVKIVARWMRRHA